MRSFYIDEASTDNNYGIYESLVINDITHHNSVGIINDKQYLYQYNINNFTNSKQLVNDYDFKFTIGKEQIHILAKNDDIEINRFNMRVIINILNEIYSYNKEKNNKMYVLVPGNFFIDERYRFSNDIKGIINECQNKYNSMLEIKQKTI